jgi:hypothetical protein
MKIDVSRLQEQRAEQERLWQQSRAESRGRVGSQDHIAHIGREPFRSFVPPPLSSFCLSKFPSSLLLGMD